MQRDLMGGPDRSFVIQTADAANGTAERYPTLTLRCGVDGNKLEVIYNPHVYLGPTRRSSGSDDIKVRLRFDARQPEEATWSPSTNGAAAFAPDPRLIYERMLRHGSLAIEAEANGTRQKVAGEFNLAGLGDVSTNLQGCLPPLPAAEITREHGIPADLIDYTPTWRVLPRGREGQLAEQRMIALFGTIETATGNQGALMFWCEGTNMVGAMQFDAAAPARVTRLNVSGSGDQRLVSYTNPRKLGSRTVALPNPRDTVRIFTPGSNFNFVMASAHGGDDMSSLAIWGSGLSPEQVQVIEQCMNQPRPQRGQPPRR